jgi:hypothetical protein
MDRISVAWSEQSIITVFEHPDDLAATNLRSILDLLQEQDAPADVPVAGRTFRYIDGNHRMEAVFRINAKRTGARDRFVAAFGSVDGEDLDLIPSIAAPDEEKEEERKRREARISMGVLPLIKVIPRVRLKRGSSPWWCCHPRLIQLAQLRGRKCTVQHLRSDVTRSALYPVRYCVAGRIS